MSLAIGQTGEPHPQVVSSVTEDLSEARTYAGSAAAASGAYPTANLAIFVPIRLSTSRTFVKAWWLNGNAAVAGNVDVGLYTISGSTLTRVAASTAEAQATLSVMQVAATFPSTTVGPGIYYLAMSCTSTTSTFWKMAISAVIGREMGVFQAATSSPLPSTATAAAWAGPTIPVFGLSELSTI